MKFCNYRNLDNNRIKKTILFNNTTGLASGNITLSQAYTNFDYLEITGIGNYKNYRFHHLIPCDSIILNQNMLLIFTNDAFWAGKFTSVTVFNTYNEAADILTIKGVKF